MKDLFGQVAVVTGGSRGIGAAVVRGLWEAGSRVVFNYRRDKSAAVALAESCDPTEVVAMRADVAKMRDAEKLVTTAVKRFGRLDILVANAGIWPAEESPIEKMTEQDWDDMISINLKGVYTVTHFAVKQMKKQESGRIIAISSTAGQRGESFHSHYGASKGGVISFVKGLATELAPANILVNCVAPGWVDTDMSRPILDDPREAAKVFATIPLRRVATPEEIAAPVLFLAGKGATFITGEILNVNGGAVLAG